MLIIEPEQLQELQRAQEKVFVRSCLSKINVKFPTGFQEIGAPKGEEENIITKALHDAKLYGIQFEDDLLMYLECIFLLGINFDKKGKLPDWPNKILTDQSLSGEAKMNLIHEYLLFSEM